MERLITISNDTPAGSIVDNVLGSFVNAGRLCYLKMSNNQELALR